VKVLATPALSGWLEPKDESFGRAVIDLCRRVVQLEGVSDKEPTQEQLDAARSKLVKKGSASAVPGETDPEPLLAALACRSPDTALRGARALAILGDMRALGALLTMQSHAPDQRLNFVVAQFLPN
jgi:ParB family chromosome partitioning protein